jgi:hypothetical protein
VDLALPTAPTIDTSLFAADIAEDISIDCGRAYVASYHAGLRILDVSDPTTPSYLGCYDTVGTGPRMNSAVARDSFAYVGWPRPRFKSLSLADPARPTEAGSCEITNQPEDMVALDSLVYITMLGGLQIVSVARPREPLLVGTCGLGSYDAWGVALEDSLVYVTHYPLAIVSISDPTQPRVVGNIWKGAFGVAIQDTLLYVAGGDLFTYSVARPSQPYLVDSLYVGDFVSAVIVVDTLAYVGCDQGVRLVDIADPCNPSVLGLAATPYGVWRLAYSPPYVYAACRNAGVCVFETTQAGLTERGHSGVWTGRRLQVRPTVAADAITVAWAGLVGGRLRLSVYDALGRVVASRELGCFSCGTAGLGLGHLAPGTYFVEVASACRREVRKVLRR